MRKIIFTMLFVSTFCCLVFLMQEKIKKPFSKEYIKQIRKFLLKKIDTWQNGSTSNSLSKLLKVKNGTIWDLFYENIENGDEIWTYHYKKNITSEFGCALVRNGKILDYIIISTN